MRKRIVITGMGAITPVGIGVDNYWRGLIEGRSGVDILTCIDVDSLPCKIGAEVKDFNPTDYMPPVEVKKTDRFVQFALAVSAMAIRDAGLDMNRENPERVGVVIGTAIGGIDSILAQQEIMKQKGPRRVSPYFLTKTICNMAAAQVAIAHGAEGPNETVVTACASGANAIGLAMRMLRYGEADVIFAGGSESIFIPLVIAGLCQVGAASTRNHDPRGACRPFDGLRDGMVLGEGAGMLILETLEHARDRGARIYGELVGFATYSDAYHPTAPAPDGRGEVRSMKYALRDAGLTPEDVDYINAHGTGTTLGDKIETMAIKQVFGEHAYRIPVSSTKGATGHLMGAGGVTELIACVKAINEGILPPTINQEQPDPDCDLDYVPNHARPARVRVAMSNSFGFGGQNASVVVRDFTG